jgi:hypothetical protein
MTTLLIAGALLVLALVAAAFARRRTARSPVRTETPVPAQLHRRDFPRPDAPWLVVLFSSATCASCGPMADKIAALESADVAVADIEFGDHRDLHERYAIAAVPIVVVVDAGGVTRASFVGAASATDLWAAVARLRDGS